MQLDWASYWPPAFQRDRARQVEGLLQRVELRLQRAQARGAGRKKVDLQNRLVPKKLTD